MSYADKLAARRRQLESKPAPDTAGTAKIRAIHKFIGNVIDKIEDYTITTQAVIVDPIVNKMKEINRKIDVKCNDYSQSQSNLRVSFPSIPGSGDIGKHVERSLSKEPVPSERPGIFAGQKAVSTASSHLRNDGGPDMASTNDYDAANGRPAQSGGHSAVSTSRSKQSVYRLSAAPSAIPAKKLDALRDHYRVYFPRLSFSDNALRRILEGDRPDQLSFERQFKHLDDGIIQPKHTINGTSVLEQRAGDDLRIYYRRGSNLVLEIILVGRKSTQKSDIKRVSAAVTRISRGLISARKVFTARKVNRCGLAIHSKRWITMGVYKCVFFGPQLTMKQ
jgi:putative component of toxin-antitoxin plasmid stabilization module